MLWANHIVVFKYGNTNISATNKGESNTKSTYETINFNIKMIRTKSVFLYSFIYSEWSHEFKDFLLCISCSDLQCSDGWFEFTLSIYFEIKVFLGILLIWLLPMFCGMLSFFSLNLWKKECDIRNSERTKERMNDRKWW